MHYFSVSNHGDNGLPQLSTRQWESMSRPGSLGQVVMPKSEPGLAATGTCPCFQAAASSKELIEALALETRRAVDQLNQAMALCLALDWSGRAASYFHQSLEQAKGRLQALSDTIEHTQKLL